MKYHILILFLSISLIVGCATRQDDAISDNMIKVLDRLPENNEVNKDIKDGITALKKNDTQKAHKAFEAGLRLDPTNGQLHFFNSLTYHVESLSGNVKMLDLAEAGYQTTLRFDPSNYWAAYFLGHIYFDDGRYVDAQNQFSYGLLYSPNNPYFLRALAVSSYYSKDRGLNRWAAKKAYAVDPDNPATLRTLIFSEAASGNIDNAKKQLKLYKERIKNDKNDYISKLTVSSLSKRINDWKYFYIASNADDPSVFSSSDSSDSLLPLDGIDDSNYVLSDSNQSDIPVLSSASNDSNSSYVEKDGFDYVIYVMLLSTKKAAKDFVAKLDYPYLEIVEESVGEFSVRRRVKEDENAFKVLAKIKKQFKDAWMRPILPVKSTSLVKVKDIPDVSKTVAVTPTTPAAPKKVSITDTKDINSTKGTSSPTVVKKVKKLPKMVLVDVVILRTEEVYTENKGVNLLDGLTATLTGTLISYNSVTGEASDGESLNTYSLATTPSFTLTGLEYNLNIFNEGANKIEILARPSLLAVENQPSKFHSGTVLHVQLSSTYSDGSMVDVPVGINLNITPKFLGSENLEITVYAERSYIEPLSERVGFQAFSQTSRTSVNATAVLKYGETLILSGLTVSENGMTRSGVPILQDIPGVQYLFSNEQKAELKKSILILLTPRKARYFQSELTPEEAKKVLKMEEEAQYAHTNSLIKQERINTNIDAVLAHMSNKKLYRQFRKGDLELDKWYNYDTMSGSIDRLLGFLYY